MISKLNFVCLILVAKGLARDLGRICHDVDILSYIQKAQIQRARKEIRMNNSSHNFRDNGFYTHLFNRVDINISSSSKSLSQNVILHNFDVFDEVENDVRLKESSSPATRVIELVSSIEPVEYGARDLDFSSENEITSRRIPFYFTFVRAPLNRFIAGYNEIEWRVSNNQWKTPLSMKVGTICRIKEFVNFLIANEGSDGILTTGTEFSGALFHIVPQIGTILHAHARGGAYNLMYIHIFICCTNVSLPVWFLR